jgi:hypothetical protein
MIQVKHEFIKLISYYRQQNNNYTKACTVEDSVGEMWDKEYTIPVRYKE